MADVEALTLTYADGPRDAEALLADPVSGDLFVVSKQLVGRPLSAEHLVDLLSEDARIRSGLEPFGASAFDRTCARHAEEMPRRILEIAGVLGEERGKLGCALVVLAG